MHVLCPTATIAPGYRGNLWYSNSRYNPGPYDLERKLDAQVECQESEKMETMSHCGSDMFLRIAFTANNDSELLCDQLDCSNVRRRSPGTGSTSPAIHHSPFDGGGTFFVLELPPIALEFVESVPARAAAVRPKKAIPAPAITDAAANGRLSLPDGTTYPTGAVASRRSNASQRLRTSTRRVAARSLEVWISNDWTAWI